MASVTDLKPGTRFLYYEWPGSGKYPQEAVLVEVAKEAVKLRHPSGNESWARTETIRVIEELPSTDHGGK